jgi:hypothetical protein
VVIFFPESSQRPGGECRIYPLSRKLGVSLRQSGHIGEDMNPLPVSSSVDSSHFTDKFIPASFASKNFSNSLLF